MGCQTEFGQVPFFVASGLIYGPLQNPLLVFVREIEMSRYKRESERIFEFRWIAECIQLQDRFLGSATLEQPT